MDGGTPDAGSLGAGVADAGSVYAGALDAGNLDGGSSDAGDDAGTAAPSPDAGRAATIDCAPSGAARLAWTLTGYQNPWNTYDGKSYLPRATDTLDGVLVSQITLSGHFSGSSDATYGPDGGLRAASLGGYTCHPVQGCFYASEAISNGTIYEGGGIVRSAQDGHVVYQFDPAPAGADAGSYWLQEGVAANGGIAVFTWSNYQVPTSTVTALDADGGMRWQHTFPHAIEAAAVDDSGITLLRMSYAGDLVAFAGDGRELYSQTPDMNLRDLHAAGGRFHLGGGTLYSVADGSQLVTVPVAPSESPLLTTSRMYVWQNDSSTGRSRIVAIDPAAGNILWERSLRQTTSAVFAFSVTDERAALIDPQDVLHVLRDDGTDLLACKVAADVTSPMLLRGGRLAVQRYPNLEVYDLPY